MKNNFSNEIYRIQSLESVFIGIGECKNFIFSKIKETDFAYLFEVNSGNSFHFEVIKKIITPTCIDFKNRVYSKTDFKEVYPKSSRFWIDAWTYTKEETAIDKLNEISCTP